ncbi:MAG TPA: hypothetical protein VK195_21195 [Burkholderiaceae bacterium]|nr:hypothetical protein [Burkholderiaceae bacterium]
MSSPSSDPRAMAESLRPQWLQLRARLQEKQLLGGPQATLSLRIPGTLTMWHGTADAIQPVQVHWQRDTRPLAAAVFAQRGDVCAVLHAGGVFGGLLGEVAPDEGRMPLVFDEQVRHLGRMPAAPSRQADWAACLRDGGNVVLVDGQPVVLGMTPNRLALNAELFEKCAKAYVLAAASGGRIKPLPWIVRHVANGRLMKDQRRAGERVAAGLLPEESKGY